MPGLLADVDPDGLLEFSVVYTDRALNHMSQKLPARDARHLGHAQGSLRGALGGARARQRHLRHGSGGAAVRQRQASAGDPQRLVQLPLDADLRHGRASPPHRRCSRRGRPAPARQAPFAPAPIDEVVATIRAQRPDAGLRAARRDRLRHDPARRLPARGGRRRACGGRPVRARLHRLGRDLGRHEADRRRRADQRAAEGLERLAVLRAGDAQRARARAHRGTTSTSFACDLQASGCRSWRPTRAAAMPTTRPCRPTR